MKSFHLGKDRHNATLSCAISHSKDSEERYRKFFREEITPDGSFDYNMKKEDVEWVLTILSDLIRNNPEFSTHGTKVSDIVTTWNIILQRVY